VAWSSCRSLDRVRFVSASRRLALSWVKLLVGRGSCVCRLAVGCVDDNRRRRSSSLTVSGKVDALGFGDHGEEIPGRRATKTRARRL
jgi:hypothetical protein